MSAPPHSAPVLVGIDGTDSGLDALALGRALAALTGAPLVLGAVHGHETLASLFGGPGWPPPEASWDWLRRASLDVGRNERCRLVTAGADSVAQGLAALVRREEAGLLVVGTSARSAAGRLRAGTGARRVVHDAGCPVAVAPPGWRAWSHAGRPVFGAAGSRETVAWARALAAAAGATLEVLESDPVECLAAAERLDLLVVGSRRRGPFGAALHSGTSASLAGRTPCPLLIAPAGSPAPAHRPPVAAAARG